ARTRGLHDRGNRRPARDSRGDGEDPPVPSTPPVARHARGHARPEPDRCVPVPRPALRAHDRTGTRAPANPVRGERGTRPAGVLTYRARGRTPRTPNPLRNAAPLC